MGKKAARNFFIWGTVICTALFIWLTIDTHTTIPKRTHTDQLTDEVVLGKRVWHKHNCNDCHTILGIGGYYSPDVTKAYSTRGEMWLKAFLKNPESPDPKRRKMPNQNLSEDEIKKLIAYFKWVDAIDTNQWPPKPVGEAKPQEVALKEKSQNLLGKNVFDQYRCDLCHKIEGKGGTIGPDLNHEGNKRDALWLEKHIRDPKSHDPNTVMPPFPQITEGEIKVLVGYLTSLK
jgi:nitric oxide reductase subunit C